MVGEVAKGSEFAVDEVVGLAVGGFAFFEEGGDFGDGIVAL